MDMYMQNKILQTPYDRFKKVFKKGEQICIYGMDWSTHGYISNIEFDGVTLTQLRNLKGIKYPWNCFEVIAHAGYKITKSKPTEIADIFEFKIITHPEEGLPSLSNIPKQVKCEKVEKIIKDETTVYFTSFLNFKAEEIEKDFIRENEKIFLGFKVGEGKCEMAIRSLNCNNGMTAKIYLSKCVQIYPQKNKELMIPIYTYLDSNLDQGDKYVQFSRRGYYYEEINRNHYVYTNKNLESLRMHEWEKEPFGCGDPVIFEGIPVDYKTWKSKDGFVMANHHADIYI